MNYERNNSHFYINIAYKGIMEIVAKDDLRNRIPPRLQNFHAWHGKDYPHKNYNKGLVSWYKMTYQKDYCQEQLGYTCQRPATSSYGSDASGN